jgi:ParB/RepB/Spo0J family partition protein
MEETQGLLEYVPLLEIEENEVALRTVDRDNEKYKELVSSVRDRGVLNPILLRNGPNGKYVVVDGLQRYSASLDAERATIPAQILDVKESEILEIQIEGNIQRVETRPGEYTKQLVRLAAAFPERTVEEQAARLHKSSAWLKERLQLKNLITDAMRRIDLAKEDPEHISVSNAYSLAKLPEEHQAEWLDRASTLPPNEFIPQCLAEAKRLKTEARTGKQTGPAEGPVAVLRKRGELKAELERALTLPDAVPEEKKQFAEGYRAAFQFIFRQDPASVAAFKAEQEAQKAERERKAREKGEKKAAADAEAGEAPSVADLLGVGAKPKPADETSND